MVVKRKNTFVTSMHCSKTFTNICAHLILTIATLWMTYSYFPGFLQEEASVYISKLENQPKFTQLVKGQG